MNRLLLQVINIARLAFRPISGNPAFFIFMFALGYAGCMLEVHYSKGAEPYPLSGTELFVDLYVVCMLLAIVPLHVRRWLRALIYVVIYPVAIIDMWCFVRLDSTLTPTMLLLVGETTGSEVSEFLSSYLSSDVILTSPLRWILLIMLLHISCNIILLIMRHMRHLPRIDKELTRKLRTWLMPLSGALTLCLLVYGCNECIDNKRAMARLLSKSTIGEVEHELTRKDKAVLYLPAYRLAFSIYANRLASRQLDKLISTTRDIAIDSCSYRSKDIVLIIGESYNRHHSQLYGYEKPTTPRQLERYRSGELVRFDDVIAPWNLTSFVFKHVFSLYSVGDAGEWCDYPLFTELFRKAGYHVTFITNQFLPQAQEAVYDFSGGFFLNNPTLSDAQFDTRNTTLHEYDEGVLDDYDSLCSHRDGPGLTIIHLKGQHVTYLDRYPPDRKKFLGQHYRQPELKGRERWILSDYDNATLYNDSIVDEILRRFEEREAIVIYMPDHGEECFDGYMHATGRLHSATIDYRLAHEEFEIPFWIWCSKRYTEARPDITEQVRAARKRPFMTDRMPHLLLYLAGISCPEYRSELNPLDTAYDEKYPRIIKNTADYDKLKNNNGEK